MTLQKKYIPQNWNEIIGQSEIVETLSQYRDISDLPHLLFVGTSGVGKTACAYVLAKELDVPIVELNASDERGIDVVREKIKTLLFTSGKRIILLDEADSLTNDAQAALRRPMEQALQRTDNRLILTVNRPWKIIDAISSRCTNLHFKPLSNEALSKISLRVLKQEGFKFKDKEEIKQIINALVSHSKGDARKLLDTIDNYSHSKESLLQYIQKQDAEVNQIREIFQAAANADWEKCLLLTESWIIQNLSFSENEIIEELYKEVKNLDMVPLKKFQLYVKLADVERNLKLQCSPLIQLSSFFMSVIGFQYGLRNE